MKKILSLALAVLMVVSAVPMVHAAGNWEGGTTVTYAATGTEEWTVTVPATLTPGNAGDVTASGTWGSNRKLVVTADDSVKLTNSINANDYKDLAVTFADINLVGDNTKAVSETKQVSVAAMPADALFGTWSGTFYYDVEMVDNVQLITFTITRTEYQAEEGMTWTEWVDSDYNTDNYQLIDSEGGIEEPFIISKDGTVGSVVYNPAGGAQRPSQKIIEGQTYTIGVY